ncbi:MAG: DUF2357 domain-containing protein [Spirochaetaceae bacterium]|jgi:hypothetical protein|nr:DUF2357 domain-containing protein [Spirochaetaceae bacterium]
MKCRLKLCCLPAHNADPVEVFIPLRQTGVGGPFPHQNAFVPEDQIGDICLLEEGVYTCKALLSEMTRRPSSLSLFLNNETIGFGSRIPPERPGEEVGVDIVFGNDFENREGSQPFLLQYDLVRLSLSVQYERVGGAGAFPLESRYYTSEYLPCLSRYGDNAENKEAILTALLEFDDDRISDLIFPAKADAARDDPLVRGGGWRKKSYKSLGAYIEMLETVFLCYEEHYPAFKSGVKHTIAKRRSMQSYRNIRNITTGSLLWLFQNSERLVKAPKPTAIRLQGDYYLPYEIHIEKSTKSFDTYENRMVLGFLQLVYTHARSIETRLGHDIKAAEGLVEKLQAMERDGMKMAVIPVKRILLDSSRSQLKVLRSLIAHIERQYPKYREILRCSEKQIAGMPEKTKVFQEVRPYRHIFEQIVEWYRFGEFKLLKESLIFTIKTMDTLFEYYCLYKILLMLQDAGITAAPRGEAPSAVHVYKPLPYHYHCEVANTYRFQRGDLRITLYYQPVIHSNSFENDITLYRTTSFHDCYTPDFMLKIERTGGKNRNASYILMDAKYSTGETIKKYYMDKTILKYSCQVSGIAGHAVKAVWILQGRPDYRNAGENPVAAPIERYHNSPLAERHKPAVSYAVIPLGGKTDMSRLWRELCAAAPELAEHGETEIAEAHGETGVPDREKKLYDYEEEKYARFYLY